MKPICRHRSLFLFGGAIIAAAVQGQPEATIAQRTGVNRMTVRKALGK